MDIETMKTFLVLVDTKNFTRTAHQLFIAQSTVTNRILELEKEPEDTDTINEILREITEASN